MIKNLLLGACAAIVLAGLWFFLQPKELSEQGDELSLSYHLSLSNGVVAGPEVLIAREGFPVEVVVTSDQADLVHLHGYELQQDIEAGGLVRLQFEATVAGRYLLELEHSGIPLASLEVYPR